ncbi:hypothetical protein LCGC14_2312930 [marine sediment metagenome]|uniref:Uncharacterized protein n=1 Tax=marine sediment metagenome TaxID=412755 RepID=A0A0F9CK47_9ZZZZ
MKNLLSIGVEKSTVLAARQTIMAILNSKAEEATKREALRTLTKITAVNNTTISGCNFSVIPVPVKGVPK